MFNHKWEPRKNGKVFELVIEIPKNIKDILDDTMNAIPSVDSVEGSLKSDLVARRKREMEKQLFFYLVMEYQQRKPQFYENPSNRVFIDYFNPFDKETCLWPHFFEIEKLPPIALADLAE